MILAWPTFTKRMAAGNLSPSPSTKPRKIPCQIFVSLQGTRFKISTKRFSPILTSYRKISNPTEITHWETVKREKFSLRVSQFGFLMLISVDKLSKLHSGRYRWPQNSIKSMTWILWFFTESKTPPFMSIRCLLSTSINTLHAKMVSFASASAGRRSLLQTLTQ